MQISTYHRAGPGAKGGAMGASYAIAEAECEWLLGSGDSAMGLCAQSYDFGGGDTVWDDERISTLHARHLTIRHENDVARHGRIRAVFQACSSRTQDALVAAYGPRGWDALLRSASGRAGKHGSMVGLVVTSRAAVGAFTARHKRAPEGGGELLSWLEREARCDGRRKLFAPLVAEARRVLTEALAEYERVRRSKVAVSESAIRAWSGAA